MLKLIILFLILVAAPLILGMPWAKSIKARYTVACAYGTGFFMELALFHAAAFLFAILYGRFSLLAIVFSVLLGIACLISLYFLYKSNALKPWKTIRSWEKPKWHEWILLVVFFAMFCIQVRHGLVSDLTVMAADDSYYIAFANDTIRTDLMGLTDPYTGVATALNMQRVIQTSLLFPSYLALLSGIPVATIAHTVQYIQLLFLAYSIYIFLSGELFDKRENRLAFLAFVSIFYIFGFHSIYSLSFRLLGPNYQGKAILAVSLTPLILAILIHILKEPYRNRYGVMLLFLSTAAVSLTLWGTGTILVIVTIPVLLSLIRKKRDWRHLLYIPWSMVIPAVFVAVNSAFS